MIHAAFDIGQVLCSFTIETFTKALSRILRLSDDESFFVLEHIQNMQDIGITKVSHALRYRFPGLSLDAIDELMAVWNSTVVPSPMMMNFLDNLRQEEVKIALLSNMGPEHIFHLRTTYPEIFVNAIQHISCEVGARKPSKLFFQSFCMDHDEFSGCVYVDDIEENLKVGKKYGFKTYQFSLEEMAKESASKQKLALDNLRKMIINKN